MVRPVPGSAIRVISAVPAPVSTPSAAGKVSSACPSAVTKPGSDSRVRQNLALVVGLQGRFDEAEKIASSELPPAEAEANVAFLKAMLAQQNTWAMLKDKDKAEN